MLITTNPVALFLEAARNNIARGWTQHHFALDVNDGAVPANSPRAVCWCAVGAMNAVNSFHIAATEARTLLEVVCRSKHKLSVVNFNDARTTTQDDVLALFDAAIAASKA